jgi:uncharacterized protein
MRSRIRKAAIAVGIVVLVSLLSSPLLLRLAEEKVIETGPNGPETLATVGLAFERLRIASGPRFLDAYLVGARSDCQPRVALLVFHGVGETISNWVQAQRLLHDQCISSLVFDYSGDGNSTGPGTAKHLDEDAVAAYGVFVSVFLRTIGCVFWDSRWGMHPCSKSSHGFTRRPRVLWLRPLSPLDVNLRNITGGFLHF